ncbi:recombinase family protein [Nonomuraea insulae]|uniref:Recombinase family protein n=1 Tax=Nonomuraea insulae TaxID=1616787 RepID=A0ABW1CA64_9ACTN
MKVIADIEGGRAKAILVRKHSRFGRNRTGNQLNLARVEKPGGELVSATEEVDARTVVGKLTRGMLFELAAFESDRAGEQWGEAFQNPLARGLPPLGTPSLGTSGGDRSVTPCTPRGLSPRQRTVPSAMSRTMQADQLACSRNATSDGSLIGTSLGWLTG